jgi:hypothetical protein
MADIKTGAGAIVKELFESTLGAATWDLIQKALIGSGEHAVAHVVKKVGDKFGVGEMTTESKSVVEDNILYNNVRSLSFTDPADLKKLIEFEKQLRLETDGKDKLAALVLFVAKGILLFKQDVTRTTGGGKNEPKETSKIIDYTAGAEWAAKFFKQLISLGSFSEQVAFLEHEDVFSLIKKEKKKIDLIVLATDGFQAARKKAEPLFEKVKEGTNATVKKVAKEIKQSKQSTLSYRERARARFEVSKQGRS